MSDQAAQNFRRVQKISDRIVIGLIVVTIFALIVASSLSITIARRNVVLGILRHLDEQAECADRVEAAFERALGEYVQAIGDPPAILTARDEMVKRTLDVQRIETGESACKVVKSPTE